MYGTWDAGQCFDAFSEKTMKPMSFSIGEFNPVVYANRGQDASRVPYMLHNNFVMPLITSSAGGGITNTSRLASA